MEGGGGGFMRKFGWCGDDCGAWLGGACESRIGGGSAIGKEEEVNGGARRKTIWVRR